MVAQKGSLMLIKVGDGALVESFTTLGGLRATNLTLNQAVMDASCVGGSGWRQLMGAAGLRSVSIQGAGLFTDAVSEERARGYAFGGNAQNYRLYFGNGDYLQGAFIISMYARSGAFDSEELYAMRLESAGDVAFVAG